MQLYFEVVSGEQKGTRALVRDGLLIGRKDAGLTIQDPRVSSRHAKVKRKGADGSLWLVDLDSQNGIKSSGVKVSKLRLAMGVSFAVGNTQIQVISVDEKDAPPKEDGAQSAMPDAETTPSAPAKPKSWREILRLVFADAAKKVDSSPKEVLPFTPVLKLTFTKGIQTGTEWIIGHGPRIAGTASSDLFLEDEELPGICFRLIPSGASAILKNESDVRVNGKFARSETLQSGDLIELKGMQIKVTFDERE